MDLTTANFEGPEKKIEIILDALQADLRNKRQGCWERVVAASRSQILSQIATDQLDAYLLAESSLFVWDNRILMITCGRTALVNAVPVILGFVHKSQITFLFYEQKNFIFPKNQPSTFEKDVQQLLQYFDGQTYRLGARSSDHIHGFYVASSASPPAADSTLQILMHDLDLTKAQIFANQTGVSGYQIAQRSGLSTLYQDMLVDAHVFEPWGYSQNSIRQNQYMTVHVTPQAGNSYASFETNIIESDYTDRIQKICSIFNPERFCVILTATQDHFGQTKRTTLVDSSPHYQASDKKMYDLGHGYMVSFCNFEKK
ncbi:MAG: hypothetical protein QNI92_10005 [Desulfobacterales bacterium]|nr:hypothetical protein [Desulfobacterales bacterium]